MKQCPNCTKLGLGPKPESEFNKRAKAPDGLQRLCRACSYDANAAWAKANPVKHAARGARYRSRNPITHRQAATRNRLKKTYGITADQYLRLFEKQNGKCALCELALINLLDSERDFTGQPDNNVARVDHCHETGRVRGLLCFGCNVGLGKFKDDTKLLLKAVRYLDESRTVLAQPNAER